MATIDRGVVTWTGTPVIGGGVTVMYARPGASLMAGIRTFFSALAGWIPNGVTLNFPSTGDSIEETTGDLVGSWTGSALTSVSGGYSGTFSGAAGASITWLTNTIIPATGGHPAHKVHGRTFLVPAAGTLLDTDGTLSTAAIASLNSAAADLITYAGGHFVVWHRPTAPGASDGVAAEVISKRIRDKAAVLTSRRD